MYAESFHLYTYISGSQLVGRDPKVGRLLLLEGSQAAGQKSK